MTQTHRLDEPETGKTRILVVDDDCYSLIGLRAVLVKHKQFAVIGTATHWKEAVRLADELKPDVVVMDVDMRSNDIRLNDSPPGWRGKEGIAAARLIRQADKSVKIILISRYGFEWYRWRARQVGADSYVPREIGEGLIDEVHKVLKGPAQIEAEGSKLDILERRVLTRIKRGLKYFTIAGEVDRTERGVKEIAKRIMRKLEANCIIQALERAREMGYFPPATGWDQQSRRPTKECSEVQRATGEGIVNLSSVNGGPYPEAHKGPEGKVEDEQQSGSAGKSQPASPAPR
jgi:DNA-binding NarL/FixJ family response regulator